MKLILYLVILILYIAITDSSINKNLKENVLSYIKSSINNQNKRFQIESENDLQDKSVQHDLFKKAMMLKRKSKKEYEDKIGKGIAKEDKFSKRQVQAGLNTRNIDEEKYQLDPVLNYLRNKDFRRTKKEMKTSSSDDTSSSSVEKDNWKEEFKQHWLQKKIEAINSTQPRGDVVNMVAARPWGVPCGDPNQHDMPWGTCMLPMECESEYRIYRGDYFCGRTQFVCCSLQLNNYDMYQGFDVSFDDSGLSTDSEEKRNAGKGSKERKQRKKKRLKKRRKKDRLKRKRKIKKSIKKIIREIRKILNRAYRNGTASRKKKTKQLKKFIKELKKKYKKDRQAVKDVHETEMLKIDGMLQAKLNKIKELNRNFMKNATFRDIVVNGTTDLKGARMLVEAYPDLAVYFSDKTRRAGDIKYNDDYDIEYGMLYY